MQRTYLSTQILVDLYQKWVPIQKSRVDIICNNVAKSKTINNANNDNDITAMTIKRSGTQKGRGAIMIY
jgi:hypothetical protein